jgi:hypothetical protein
MGVVGRRGGRREEREKKRQRRILSCETARKSAPELAAGPFWRYILAWVSSYEEEEKRDLGTGDGSRLCVV